MQSVAKLKNLHLSSRKIRLIVNLIKNMNVIKALKVLKYSSKRGSVFLEKLLLSVISNWQNKNKNLKIEDSNLYIKSIFTNSAVQHRRVHCSQAQPANDSSESWLPEHPWCYLFDSDQSVDRRTDLRFLTEGSWAAQKSAKRENQIFSKHHSYAERKFS